MAKKGKLYELDVRRGDDLVKVLGRPIPTLYEYENGKVYDLVRNSCSEKFFVHNIGRVFVPDALATPVPESHIQKYNKVKAGL